MWSGVKFVVQFDNKIYQQQDCPQSSNNFRIGIQAMHINTNDAICGINILSVRNFLRASGRVQRWRTEYVASFLKLDEVQSGELLVELEKRGYVEKEGLHGGEQYWHNTIRGNSLGSASATKPYKRKTAEKALMEFMKRVQTVNASPYYLYKVAAVILFGSYLTEAPEVSDVDIALKIVSKEENSELRGLQLEKRRADLEKSGKRFNSIVDWAGAAEIEVWNFLKSRSRVISMHVATEELLELVGGKVILDEVQNPISS